MTAPQRVAGIVLASGLSRRFGRENKLLAPIEGEATVRRVLRAYLAVLDPVYVVVGYEAERVRAALDGLDVRFLDNPEYAAGQSRALVRGVAALDPAVEAAVIGVADQPYLSAEVVAALVSAWRDGRAPVVAPRYAGEPGNPILFDRRLFPELLAVTGDRGGRPVFGRHAGDAIYLDFGARPGLDIDTLQDYERLQ